MKNIFILSMIMLVIASFLYAETVELVSKSKAKVENLEKIKSSREKTKVVVAGAKATEQVSEDELYWAGKDEVTDQEIAMFKSSLDFIEKGDIDEGKKKLKQFIEIYHKSVLIEDALALLKELERKN
ncbi:MAG: hypothetical protein K6348_05330 [Deferribacterales bacterium]